MAITNLSQFFNFNFTDKDGKLTSDAHLFMDQLSQDLNSLVILMNGITSTIVNKGSVTINGLNPPSKTTAEIAAIVAETDPKKQVPLGTIWYDSTIKKLKFLANTGAVETITSAP